MNKSLENLALRKQLLQVRSTYCRLRIRHELNAMRGALSWALPVRSAVLGLALVGVSHSRLARLLTLAARMLLLARLTSIAVKLLRKPSALERSEHSAEQRWEADGGTPAPGAINSQLS